VGKSFFIANLTCNDVTTGYQIQHSNKLVPLTKVPRVSNQTPKEAEPQSTKSFTRLNVHTPAIHAPATNFTTTTKLIWTKNLEVEPDNFIQYFASIHIFTR